MTLPPRLQQAMATLPRLLTIVNEDTSASWQWRVAWPSRILANHGFIADWILNSELNSLVPLLAAGRYNIVIMSRLHWADAAMAEQWSQLLHEHGIVWVYGADDDVWTEDSDTHAPMYADFYQRRGPEQLEQDRHDRHVNSSLADAVLVSTEHLADQVRQRTTKPVICIPNLIDTDWFRSRLEDAKRIVPPLTVGWSGSYRPDADMQTVADAWTYIAKQYPQVNFVIHGALLPTLMRSVPSDRLTIRPWSSLSDYPRALMNIDIACCYVPESGDFSLAKSPIKWQECTLAGAACVVSQSVYADVVGDTSLIARTSEDWQQALGTLIENPQLRQSLQQQAYQRVLSQFSLDSQWATWPAQLCSLVGEECRV